MLFDIHCHLNEFNNPEKVIKKAKENNVTLIFSNSVDLNSSNKNLELQEKFNEVKALIGLHPSNLLTLTEKERHNAIKFIEENIRNAFGIGETGLDFKHADSKEKQLIQKEFFEKQIRIAVENNKFIAVHSRQARKQCIELLEKFNAKKVLMHWFSGSKKLIERIISNNWFISVGPSIFNAEHIQLLAKQLPLENLMLETDAPVRFSGKTAEPSWIKEIAFKTALIKGISFKKLEDRLEENLKQI